MWKILQTQGYQFNMYNTDDLQNRFCFFYYQYDDFGSFGYIRENQQSVLLSIQHLTSYCFRPSQENEMITNLDHDVNRFGQKLTFTDLRERNVTSTMLLLWSASIDIAEKYQILLNNKSKSIATSDFVFYNCTSPWFGPVCQFITVYKEILALDDLIKRTFQSTISAENSNHVTCYEHLACQTYQRCLDWRQICDGMNDCIDGSDEKDCWQLEINQCNVDEYRCRNGQCIPIEFVYDNVYGSDCSDDTDERLDRTPTTCIGRPLFACEEYTCESRRNSFSCPNDVCKDGNQQCYILEKKLLMYDHCSNVALCLLRYVSLCC